MLSTRQIYFSPLKSEYWDKITNFPHEYGSTEKVNNLSPSKAQTVQLQTLSNAYNTAHTEGPFKFTVKQMTIKVLYCNHEDQ